MKRYIDLMHGVADGKYLCREVGTDETFWVDTSRGLKNAYPVPGCIGGARDKFGMYRHFSLRHPEARIVIMVDSIVSKCILCDFQNGLVRRCLELAWS